MSEDKALCGGDLYWQGCYGSDAKYKQLVTRDSYAHPAKASFRLIDRIYDHLEALGLLKKDSVVVDFMAGTARIPLLANLRGHRTIAVELEQHFVKMIEDNKAQTEKHLGRTIDMRVIRGDARNLSSLLGESGVGVTSPPYMQEKGPRDDIAHIKKRIEQGKIPKNHPRFNAKLLSGEQYGSFLHPSYHTL